MSILNSFTPGRTPRACQVEALLAAEANWDKADVFVFQVPVGGGKSDLSTSLARWAALAPRAQKSLIVVPNNVLLRQYQDSNPRLAVLHAKHGYECSVLSGGASGTWNCADAAKELGHVCKGCPYTAANRRVRAVPYAACNTWTYMAHKLYPSVLIADEAHNLRGMLRDLAAKVLWQHEYRYPTSLRSYRDLLDWVTAATAERPGDLKLAALKADLTSGGAQYLVERGEEKYFGKLKPCLKMLPIDTSKQPPLLWPKQVQKVVLLSATIAPPDLVQLGLNRRRVCWVETSSPIPAAQRPCYVAGADLRMSRDAEEGETSEADVQALATRIVGICKANPDTRGVIHATYALLPRIRTALQALDPRLEKRLITHDKDDKLEQYQEFLAGPTDAVLLCAGFSEGIDLAGPLARFQIICKIAWPFLGEPAWKYLSETDPKAYEWEALKTVLQTYGRVCRGPQDRGATYILDRSFSRLPRELFPAWFEEALIEN